MSNENKIDRRDFGTAVAAVTGTALLVKATTTHGQPRPRQVTPLALLATPSDRVIAPLPFAPASLPGLSERMMVSHHDNNYAGAVRKLNEIRQQLGSADPARSGGYWSLYGSLRTAELAARNSSLLHELFFANLGAGQQPSVPLATMIAQRFGAMDRFRAQFLGAAKASNGWVLLVTDPGSRTLEIVQTDGHGFGAWEAVPLLVMDLYEHAYALDYAANKQAYFDAFWNNVHWGEVHVRATRSLGRL